MKYVLTIAITLCTLCYCAPFKKSVSQKSPISLTTEPVTLADKFAVLNEFAVHLENEGKISISAEKFAKILTVVLYSESGLKTNTELGIFRIQKKVRKSLGIPNLKNATFAVHLRALEIYLDNTNHLNYIKSTTDLHVLLLTPTNFNKEILMKAKDKLTSLDLDNDGFITRNDLKMFDKNRANENNFIRNLQKSLEISPSTPIFAS